MVTVSSVASSLVVSPTERPVTVAENGPVPTAVAAGTLACSTTFRLPPAAIGPVSGTPSPLVSSSGVTPSAAKNTKVVPAGNELADTARLTVSLPVPALNTVWPNLTLPPATADARVVRSLAVPLGVPGVASTALAAVEPLAPTTTL